MNKTKQGLRTLTGGGKMKNKINGLIKFKNEIQAFSFIDDTLTVYYNYGVAINCEDEIIISENIIKSDEFECLYGYITDTAQKIVFFTSGTYGTKMANGVNSKKLRVFAYVLYKVGREILPISTMKLTGDEINYFFPPNAGVSVQIDNNKFGDITIPCDNSNDTKSFSFKTGDGDFVCNLDIYRNWSGGNVKSSIWYQY
jgi:hypothetical protein